MNIRKKQVHEAQVVRELELREFGQVHGVTCDDRGHVWFAYGDGGLVSVEPADGRVVKHFPDFGAKAGTTFDGTHLWQIKGCEVVRLDPATGAVVHSVPLPDSGEGCEYSGMAWAEGALWVGRFRGRQIVKLSPETGAVLKTLDSDQFVTGITWIDGELWHGGWDNTEPPHGAALRRVDPETGEVQATIAMPDDFAIAGVGADREGRLWCGGSHRGGLRAVRRPARTDER